MKVKMILGFVMMCSMFMGVQPLAVRAEEQTTAQTVQMELEIQEETVFSDTHLFETGLKGVTMQGGNLLYYEVEHKGVGAGIIEVSGYATGDYDVVVKIVKSGVIGEAVFQISLDGGNTYIGQDIVADSSKIGDAGITLYFKTEEDTVEFIEEDEYFVSVPESFQAIPSKVNTANVLVLGHPLEEHDFVVNILSSGGLGSSRFTVNSTKGRKISVTDVIPKDGKYELEDDITLIFSDSTDYEKGLNYTVSIKSNDETVDYTMLYVLCGVVIVSIIVALSFLTSKKETDSEYRICKYKWQKEDVDYEG